MVRAALRADIHGSAGGMPKRRVVRRNLHPELRNRARRRNERHSQSAIAQVGRGIGDAINLKLGIKPRPARHRNLRRTARRRSLHRPQIRQIHHLRRSRASSIGLPPRIGKSWIRRWSITVPTEAVPVSSSGALPFTSTLSATLPTSSITGRSRVSPTRTSTWSMVSFLNPVNSAVN